MCNCQTTPTQTTPPHSISFPKRTSQSHLAYAKFTEFEYVCGHLRFALSILVLAMCASAVPLFHKHTHKPHTWKIKVRKNSVRTVLRPQAKRLAWLLCSWCYISWHHAPECMANCVGSSDSLPPYCRCSSMSKASDILDRFCLKTTWNNFVVLCLHIINGCGVWILLQQMTCDLLAVLWTWNDYWITVSRLMHVTLTKFKYWWYY